MKNLRSWLCYYQAEFPEGKTPNYDLYVLAGTNHPDLKPLKEKGKITVGYISFGEVTDKDHYYGTMKNAGVLVDENPSWPGAFRIDLRSEKWQDYIVEKLIPSRLEEGFDGIFIDTIDTADYLEREKGMKGSVQSTVDLLKKIREKFPKLVVVLNNGLFMLEDVGDFIDAIVVEDIYTSYDFDKKEYLKTSEGWTRARIISLKKFQKRFGKKVLALDYADESDKKWIKEIARMSEKEGFVPYIADIHLNTIFFHP